jgi:hypothetical protein
MSYRKSASFLCAAAFCASLAFGQNPPPSSAKTLLIDRPDGNDPIRIVKIMDGAAEPQSNDHQHSNKHVWEATFPAGDDWLKDLSFRIRNVSRKKIVNVTVGCLLYESADWPEELAKHAATPVVGSIANTVGRRPEEALYSEALGHRLKPDASRPTFELPPDTEFTISLEDPKDYPALRARIEEKQFLSSVTACNSRVGEVFFADGTQWQGHHYLRADPERNGHWIRMSLEEWSGTTSAKPGENRYSPQNY